MLETLLEALIDTAKVVPILLLVYILIAYLSHRTDEPYKFLTKKGRYFGPLIGASLGSIPQCGFSAVMADLYSKRAITIGTLFAVFLTTSDEAVPILIANPTWYKELLLIIGIKFLIGILFGYIIDFIFKIFENKKLKNTVVKETPSAPLNSEIHELCSCGHTHLCSCSENNADGKHEHKHEHKHEKCCADNIFLDALIHTAKISAYILLFNVVFGVIIYYVGMDSFINFVSINPYLQPLAISLVGLIPNCAASVFITEIYMAGGITLSATIAGLSTGSGIGILILFKQNKNIKANLLILASMYIIGVIVGLALTPIL